LDHGELPNRAAPITAIFSFPPPGTPGQPVLTGHANGIYYQLYKGSPAEQITRRSRIYWLFERSDELQLPQPSRQLNGLLLTPVVPTGSPSSFYGFGFVITTENGHKIVGHNGQAEMASAMGMGIHRYARLLRYATGRTP
jgi:hypothetical protein